jgi:hypothetical protein
MAVDDTVKNNNNNKNYFSACWRPYAAYRKLIFVAAARFILNTGTGT